LDGSSDVCPVCALNSALQPDNHATATELRFEHYQILKNEDQSLMELGHGAMGVTYKALDVQLQRPVALKIINAKLIGDASARQRFVREARAAASVRPPNVATVTEVLRSFLASSFELPASASSPGSVIAARGCSKEGKEYVKPWRYRRCKCKGDK
jgi:hypothetical protein